MLVPLVVVPTMLVTGFFVNEENVPWFFEPLKWIAIMKYGYQALYLNEYTDIEGLDCLTAENPKDKCDPISDLDSPQNIVENIIILCIIWVVSYSISFCCLRQKSKKYKK